MYKKILIIIISIISAFIIVDAISIAVFNTNGIPLPDAWFPKKEVVEAPKDTISQKLNGFWANKKIAFTVTIDINSHKYSGVAFGERFNEDIAIDSTDGNVVFFTVSGKELTAQFISEDDIIVTKKDGIPTEMKRVKI